MSRQNRSRRARLTALSADLRAQGCSWADIAIRFQQEEGVPPLVSFRLAHGLTQCQLAEQWNDLFLHEDGTGAITDKQVSYWETWPQSGHEPSLKTLKRLARMYECDIGDLVEGGRYSHLDDTKGAPRAGSESDGIRDETRTSARTQSLASGLREDKRPRDSLRRDRVAVGGIEEDDMRRRSLLAASGVVAVDAMLGRSPRVLEALRAATSDSDDVDVAHASLSELISYYSQVVSMAPSSTVYDELLSIRCHANSLLARDGRLAQARRSDLTVTAGQLSSLLAVSATDLGDHASALVWCADAERRGHSAGYPELLGWAALTRALIAYYNGQASQSASLAYRGQSTAPMGTAAHAKLAAQEMRARALLGDAQGMTSARHRASAAMDSLAPNTATSGAFSFPTADDPPYTATSLLLVNRYGEAAEATHRVIETVYRPQSRSREDQPTNYARSLLILGLAEAGLGRIDAAATAGNDALQCGKPVWPTMVLARKLDRILTKHSSASALVTDYHHQYSEAAQRSPRQPSTLSRTR
jgi:transcriptional regulator with XRE-family HTH domain